MLHQKNIIKIKIYVREDPQAEIEGGLAAQE